MRSFLLASLLATTIGCSPYDPDLGGAPYLCADTEPKCPDGYTCQPDTQGNQICLSTSGNVIDAPSNGFQCKNDSNLETSNGTNNDTKESAFLTGIPQSRMSLNLSDLAICPEGDRDTYMLSTSVAAQNIEATTTWTSGDPVTVVIQNATGNTIATAQPAGEMMLRAYAANVNAGTYYVQVSAGANTKNNYTLLMAVTGP